MYIGAGLSNVFSPIQSLKMDAEGDTERHPDFSYLVSDLPRDMGDSEIAIAVVASHHPLIDDLYYIVTRSLVLGFSPDSGAESGSQRCLACA